MGKTFEKKILKKKFWNKNFGKINYKTKIFMAKIYSKIDKCHTFFALLEPLDKTGWKTWSNEIVCGIWFKIGSVARLHWTQGMWRFKRSQEKRYIKACELSVTRLPQERYLLYQWYGILVPGWHPRCWIYRYQYIGFNSRYFSGIRINVIKSYVWCIIFGISTTTTVP